jgi:uncharacterized membrane protein YraQ (UPF0718 family)
MFIPTLVMGFVALCLVVAAALKGPETVASGVKSSAATMASVAPLLLFAFVVAGMIGVLLPPETVARWVGAESGARGILIGTLAGGFAPGGPYVSLPVAAGLLKSGAGVGTMVAFLTAWSLLAFARLPMEVGILGWKFTLVRLACTFFFAPVAGLIAHVLFREMGPAA